MAKKRTVLLVDDDKFLLDMYKKKFEREDFLVDVATSADETITKLKAGAAPEILILDIIMPGTDGIELLEIIRKENLASNSIVIMLTNESDHERVEKAQSLGVKGYIVKATAVPSEVVEKVLEIAQSQDK